MPKKKITKKKTPANSGKTQVIRRDKKGRFKEGFSANPIGPEPGYTQFKTDFKKAAIEIAEALRLGKEPDPIRIELIKRGIKEGLSGKFPFWKEFMERLYGTVKENLDVSGEIKSKVELTDEQVKQLIRLQSKRLNGKGDSKGKVD